MLELWEVILPLHDNDGVALHMAHKRWRRHMLDCFGGFIQSEVAGEWKGDDGLVTSGTTSLRSEGESPHKRIYRDKSVSYRVLVPADGGGPSLDNAFAWFPDQLAIYRGRLGAGEIVERPDSLRP